MNITINNELRAYTDPLTANEYAALERSILAEGCRDALVLWGDVLIDGHNRYAICRKHGIDFKTIQNDSFATIEDVMLWMIDNHLARRSVSDFQRGMLALRKKAILNARAKEQQDSAPEPAVADAPMPPPPPLSTREEVAKAAGISSNAISRIERIQKAAAPELVEAIRAGTISINAAAAVASLPSEAQVAAVAAGKKELQQIARQVREAKSPSRAPRAEPRHEEAGTTEPLSEVEMLRARIDALNAENAALKAQVAALTASLDEARRAA
jgi:transcriptional regulator with XRE-family HTH domain